MECLARSMYAADFLSNLIRCARTAWLDDIWSGEDYRNAVEEVQRIAGLLDGDSVILVE